MFAVDRVLSFSYPTRELAIAGWACLDNRVLPDQLWVECEGIRAPALMFDPAYSPGYNEENDFICRINRHDGERHFEEMPNVAEEGRGRRQDQRDANGEYHLQREKNGKQNYRSRWWNAVPQHHRREEHGDGQ